MAALESSDHFLNMVLALTGLILVVAGIFRMGRFVNLFLIARHFHCDVVGLAEQIRYKIETRS